MTGDFAGKLDLGLSVTDRAVRTVADASVVLKNRSLAMAAFAQGWADYEYGTRSVSYGATAGLRLRW